MAEQNSTLPEHDAATRHITSARVLESIGSPTAEVLHQIAQAHAQLDAWRSRLLAQEKAPP